MTRLVTKSGPALSPIPLEKQLESAVAYEREKFLQLNCVPSHSLPSDYALRELHSELSMAVSRA